MSHASEQYTSDLTDEQWAIVMPLLPVKRTGAGWPIELDMRAVLNAILYLVRTGCQWDDIPRSYPNHNSVYYHYRKELVCFHVDEIDKLSRIDAMIAGAVV